MKTCQKYRASNLLCAIRLTGVAAMMAAVIPTGAMAESSHGTMDHGASEHSTDLVPTPEGMAIAIVEPADHTIVESGGNLVVEVETSGMDISGDHWHLYVDGEMIAMVGAGRAEYELELDDIGSGMHSLEVRISNAQHKEYDTVDSRMIEVK